MTTENWTRFDLGAVAQYHSQPPFETPAAVWYQARTITPDMTIGEVLAWADRNGGLANVVSLTITQRATGRHEG